jgi:hypothetical protein
MDHHPAARMSLRDRFPQLDTGVAEIVGGDVAEDIGGHHAHRGPAQHLVTERTGTVAQHDPVGILLDDPEITLDAALEVDQHGRDLLARQAVNRQSGLVVMVDLLADLGTPPTTSIEQRQNSPCHCLLNTLPLSRSFLHAKIFGSKAQSISLWLRMIVNLNKFVLPSTIDDIPGVIFMADSIT